MTKQTVIKKETLVPIGFILAVVPFVILALGNYYDLVNKTNIQAAEIEQVQKTQSKYESHVLAIYKALSRIEGTLETMKK